RISEEIGASAPDKVKATLMTLLCRVAVNPHLIEINISRPRLAEMLTGQSIDVMRRDHEVERDTHEIATLTSSRRTARLQPGRWVSRSADRSAAACTKISRSRTTA